MKRFSPFFNKTSYIKKSTYDDENYMPVSVQIEKETLKQDTHDDWPKKIALKRTTHTDYYGNKDNWVEVSIRSGNNNKWRIVPGHSVQYDRLAGDNVLYLYGNNSTCAEKVGSFVKKSAAALHESKEDQDHLQDIITFFSCREKQTISSPQDALTYTGLTF
jgi:hypothetical protein